MKYYRVKASFDGTSIIKIDRKGRQVFFGQLKAGELYTTTEYNMLKRGMLMFNENAFETVEIKKTNVFMNFGIRQEVRKEG